MTEWLHFHFSLSCIGEGNGNPLQCSCLENPRDGSLVGCHLWGRTVGHDWSDLAADLLNSLLQFLHQNLLLYLAIFFFYWSMIYNVVLVWNWNFSVKLKVSQLCPTLCDPMDCTVHGILQATILEWVAFPFSRGSYKPRGQTQVSLMAGGLFTSWATREAQKYWSREPIPSPVDLPDPGIKPGSPALQGHSLPAETVWSV